RLVSLDRIQRSGQKARSLAPLCIARGGYRSIIVPPTSEEDFTAAVLDEVARNGFMRNRFTAADRLKRRLETKRFAVLVAIPPLPSRSQLASGWSRPCAV